MQHEKVSLKNKVIVLVSSKKPSGISKKSSTISTKQKPYHIRPWTGVAKKEPVVGKSTFGSRGIDVVNLKYDCFDVTIREHRLISTPMGLRPRFREPESIDELMEKLEDGCIDCGMEGLYNTIAADIHKYKPRSLKEAYRIVGKYIHLVWGNGKDIEKYLA